MPKKKEYDHKHLSTSQRIHIEKGLNDGLSFAAIARRLIHQAFGPISLCSTDHLRILPTHHCASISKAPFVCRRPASACTMEANQSSPGAACVVRAGIQAAISQCLIRLSHPLPGNHW